MEIHKAVRSSLAVD